MTSPTPPQPPPPPGAEPPASAGSADGRPPGAATAGRPGNRARRSRAIGIVIGWIGVGVLAGAVWSLLAPTPVGTVVDGAVRYRSLDDPAAVIHAQFIVITGICGLLTGVVTLGLGVGGLARRTVLNLLAGTAVAGLTYLVGFLLGPPTEAAQLAAGRTELQPPLVLATPLLILVWPMVTSLVIAVGTLLSLVLRPPRRPGQDG